MGNPIPLLQTHPLLSGLLALAAVLAVVGFWYVVHHHLRVILVTLLCSSGAACGAVVFWRGFTNNMVDLIVIGLFLMALFPYLLVQAIRRESTYAAHPPSAASKPPLGPLKTR